MTAAEALTFVRKHGVVLEAATGPVPSLASAIAGAPIRGSWWSHAKGGEIFKLTRAVETRPTFSCAGSSRVRSRMCTGVSGLLWYVLPNDFPAIISRR